MDYRTTRYARLLPMVSLLAACGPETDAAENTMENGSSGQITASASDTEGYSGETEGDSGETDEDGASSTGEPACELPEDDELDGSMITISIQNRTDETRYISPYSSFGCNYSQFELVLDGEPVLWDHASTSASTCSICGVGCSDGGADGLVIGPGQTAEVQWNGGYWASTTRSEACAVEACESIPGATMGALECDVLRAMTEAEYTIRINVFDTCPASLEEAGDCDCDGEVCEAFFYEPRPGDYTVEATETYPAGAVVILE